MIIACPACQTRYVVPDSAVGIEGRTVRCAKCKHAWFQEGPEADRLVAGEGMAPPAGPRATGVEEDPVARASPQDEPAQPRGRRDAPAELEAADAPAEGRGAPPAPEPVREPVREPAREPVAEPSIQHKVARPDFDEAEPPSYAQTARPPLPPAAANEDAERSISPFDAAPPFRPRRNRMALWTWAAAIFAVLALGTVATLGIAGTPGWWPFRSSEWGQAQPDLELRFPPEEQSWRELSNRTRLFSARVLVTNTSREVRKLPPVLIIMLDERERQVFSWVVQPPQPTLAPGETITIDEARTDVPRNAVFAEVGWAPV